MDLSPRRATLALLVAVALAGCGSGHHRARASADDQPVFHPAAPTSASAVASAQPSAPEPAVSKAAAPSASPTRTPGGGVPSRPASPVQARVPAPYQFAPRAAASGPTPAAVLSVADLAVTPGRDLTVTVSQSKPGAIYLNSYTATGTAAMPGFRACVRQASGPACTPVAVPDPAYWPVTAADVARSTHYQVVMTVVGSTSALLGVHVGTDGAHTATVAGVRVPGGCATGGYKAGCGARAHLVLGSGGPVTLSSATAGLHVNIKDKTSNTKLASQVLRGSITNTLPAGHEWSMHLWSDDGSPISSVSLTVTWP